MRVRVLEVLEEDEEVWKDWGILGFVLIVVCCVMNWSEENKGCFKEIFGFLEGVVRDGCSSWCGNLYGGMWYDGFKGLIFVKFLFGLGRLEFLRLRNIFVVI